NAERAPLGARFAFGLKPTLASSGLADVFGRRPLRPLDDVELDGIALRKRFEPASLDGTVVHEAILRAVIRGDETETLRVVEPLYFAGRTHSSLREENLSRERNAPSPDSSDTAR